MLGIGGGALAVAFLVWAAFLTQRGLAAARAHGGRAMIGLGASLLAGSGLALSMGAAGLGELLHPFGQCVPGPPMMSRAICPFASAAALGIVGAFFALLLGFLAWGPFRKPGEAQTVRWLCVAAFWSSTLMLGLFGDP
jgi:hypothetical protein